MLRITFLKSFSIKSFSLHCKDQTLFSKRLFYSHSTVSNKKYLIKNLLFTLSFSAGVFTLAAVIDDRKKSTTYFNHRIELLRKNSQNGIFKRIIQLPQYQQTVFALIAVNTAVFLSSLSRSPKFVSFFNRHFVNRFHSPHYTVITSSFAHSSFAHYAFNMVALYSFGTILHQLYGREQFLAFYCSALAISAHCSLVAKYVQHSFLTGSLGASGAIFGIIGSLLKFKGLKVSVVFLPFVHIPLYYAALGMAAFDLYGLVARLHYFDHAAHLAGLAFGYFYFVKGQEIVSKNRRKYLHQLGLCKRR